MIFELNDKITAFPDPALAEEDGLLAIGGDLSIERLTEAYRNGIFPWFSEGDPICWFSPHERCVIFPDKIHVGRTMRRLLSVNHFTITENTEFESVIRQCQKISRKGQEGTWITRDMEAAYVQMHNAGLAHSIEVWHEASLAGGIYGVIINNVFCGESMFSLQPNASKAAMIWLCKNKQCRLLDCQVPNDHLLRMGAEMMPRKEFMKHLRAEI